jgi:Transposase DDE domain
MSHAAALAASGRVAAACQDFIDSPGLPFAEHLPEKQVEEAFKAEGVPFRRRLFSPFVTLWAWLSQSLDPDPSCRSALARFLAWRVSRRLPACSADTGSYCRARARLPEAVLRRLTRETGRNLQSKAAVPWLWKGRAVKVADGTFLSMPDTEKNQQAYPQSRRAKPGCGFPLVRVVVLFSLAVGTVLDVAFGKHHGKGEGEQSLFRRLLSNLQKRDVLLGDRNYCSYWVLAAARLRDVDAVLRLNPKWQKDLHACRRLANGDRLMRLVRPARPGWMSKEDYAEMPLELWVRVVRVRVRQAGFRTRSLLVATTLVDIKETTAAELADLYRARWQCELNLRSLKVTLQMDVLRCEDPEMVRKEIWAHLLAYNLVRSVMAQAAQRAGCKPRDVSFKATVQLLNAFLPYLRAAHGAEERARLWDELLQAVQRHRVGNRPDRVEPRMTKRRPKNFPWLTKPREEVRARLLAAA